VVVTGTSRRQLRALAEDIDHKLRRDLGDRRMGLEGFAESNWILLDFGTVVIHLFDEETRNYFALENLWGEGRRIAWEEYAPV
jgi:ribosome-associated protein